MRAEKFKGTLALAEPGGEYDKRGFVFFRESMGKFKRANPDASLKLHVAN